MKEKILGLLKAKGYYMVLAVAVLTVGTVSFLTYRAYQKEQAQTPIPQNPTQDVEKVEEGVPDDREEQPEPQKPSSDPAPQPEETSYIAPLTGEIIAHYSPEQPVYSYTLNDWRTHSGIDIAAAEGTQVVNVCDGVVEEVLTDDLMGVMAVIRHTDGKVSRYASLEVATVEAGQMVKQGDPIGKVGKTMLLECGETEHLHYELWQDDQPVDPSFLIS